MNNLARQIVARWIWNCAMCQYVLSYSVLLYCILFRSILLYFIQFNLIQSSFYRIATTCLGPRDSSHQTTAWPAATIDHHAFNGIALHSWHCLAEQSSSTYCKTLQHNTIHHETMQYSTVAYSTIQYGLVQSVKKTVRTSNSLTCTARTCCISAPPFSLKTFVTSNSQGRQESLEKPMYTPSSQKWAQQSTPSNTMKTFSFSFSLSLSAPLLFVPLFLVHLSGSLNVFLYKPVAFSPGSFGFRAPSFSARMCGEWLWEWRV